MTNATGANKVSLANITLEAPCVYRKPHPFCGLCALEDAIDVTCRLPHLIGHVDGGAVVQNRNPYFSMMSRENSPLLMPAKPMLNIFRWWVCSKIGIFCNSFRQYCPSGENSGHNALPAHRTPQSYGSWRRRQYRKNGSGDEDGRIAYSPLARHCRLACAGPRNHRQGSPRRA